MAKTEPGPDDGDLDVQAVRAALEADRERLLAEREDVLAGLAEVIRDSVAGSGDDQADAGAKTLGREQEQSLLSRVTDSLEQTDRALERLDAGTYGDCESCGGKIGSARLEAFPRATLCVSCKAREERR
jgi:RNA polymerase-binding transcription factor